MRLGFEDWILSQDIGQESKEVIREAFLCYKSSAYRAALVFSYSCFMSILKGRVLNAEKPETIEQQAWEKSREKLENDDVWESEAFQLTQRKEKQIFQLNEGIRTQVLFWKDRRNDCAHSKGNQITNAHVEAFWAFIKSNLIRFVVIGSRESIIERVGRYLDKSITPNGSDCTSLIDDIHSYFNGRGLIDFLKEFEVILTRASEKNAILFLGEVFRLKDNPFERELSTFLAGTIRLDIVLFNNFPDRIHLMRDNPEYIRNLWYEKIANSSIAKRTRLFATLLRNGLIPDDQIEEAIIRVVEYHGNEIPDQVDFDTLNSSDYFKCFHDHAFLKNSIGEFKWGNSNCDAICYYLEKFPLDNEIVKSICDQFSSEPYPFKVRDALAMFFETNEAKRNEFMHIAEVHSIPLPRPLGFVK